MGEILLATQIDNSLIIVVMYTSVLTIIPVDELESDLIISWGESGIHDEEVFKDGPLKPCNNSMWYLSKWHQNKDKSFTGILGDIEIPILG